MEVIASIRFTTPSLGNLRNERRDKMLRNAEGKVIYLQSWWRAGLRYAAQARGLPNRVVDAIQADPVVEGTPSVYRRYYSSSAFKEHEAFQTGDILRIRFCLPSKLSIEQFTDLLSCAGRFVGVSPYGYKQDFGRFVVVSVEPVSRFRRSNDGSVDPSKRKPDTRISSERKPSGAEPDVQTKNL